MIPLLNNRNKITGESYMTNSCCGSDLLIEDELLYRLISCINMWRTYRSIEETWTVPDQSLPFRRAEMEAMELMQFVTHFDKIF